MRNLGRFCHKYVVAFMLTLAFACSTFAGDVQYPGGTPTPPTTTNGEMQFPGATVDPTTEIALSLLRSVLSLF